jgi:hypothetical protein
VSVLSWLPDDLVRSAWLFHGARALYWVSAAVWLAGRALRVSSALAVGSLVVVTSLQQESRVDCAHSAHLTVQAVMAFCLWTQLDAGLLAAAKRAGTFWSASLVPRWLGGVLALAVGWFYTLTGCAKLIDSGLAWADGLTLQLYVLALAPTDGTVAQVLISSRTLARTLQCIALAVEVLALPLALLRSTRALLGVGLIAFHVGQVWIFGYPFWGNVAVIAVALLGPRLSGVSRAVSRG